jgi:cellulose synthase/poly-beta-1,6-N-acetylglucosamine synthase-like glycosyltransferase
MKSLTVFVKLRHLLIISKWQRWLFPAVCLIPYFGILFWLLLNGLIWVAQVLLAPLLMGGLLALLTYLLAEAEFNTKLPKR